jgi:hypothetical protein
MGRYVIGRVPLQVTFGSTRLLGPVRSILRPWAGGPAEDIFRLAVRYGSEPSHWRDADSWRLFWSGMLPGGIRSEYYAAAGQRVVSLPGRAWGRLDSERKTIDVVCRPGQEGCVSDGCLVPLLCEFLAHHGHFVIHAASLGLEREGRTAGVLLAGQSGAGKTTTALALAHAGMTLLTDDASFIETQEEDAPSVCVSPASRPRIVGGTPATPQRVRLWGWQLPCKVQDNTQRLLPWLQTYPAQRGRVAGEACVDVAEAVGKSAGVVADPGLLLLLGPRCRGDHRIEPLERLPALVQLTGENIRAYEHRAESTAGRAFRALGQLVAQCRVYRLCVGEPLSTLAGRIRRLLE